jgi:hypothetical protein
MVTKPLLWSQQHESRLEHFLNSKVGNMPTIIENLQSRTSFSVQSALTPLLTKNDEGSIQFTCETTRSRIDDNQNIKEHTWSE